MTPGMAIHKHCVSCVGSVYQVYDCQGDVLLDGTVCLFFKYRLGKGRPSVKVIRKFCLHYCCGSFQAVQDCLTKSCFLYPYRFGKNPNYRLSDDRKEQLSLRLKKARMTMDVQRENGGFTGFFLA